MSRSDTPDRTQRYLAGERCNVATMEYDGYIGVIDLDEDANLLHGQVVNTRDVITFQGRNVKELRAALKDSIDDYLEFCRKRGEEPEKPFSGKFMVRVDPLLHRELTLVAATEGKSVQSVVREAIQERVVRKARPHGATSTVAKKRAR